MRILIAHNAYQHSGGEDAVVDAEIALLRSYGHDVEIYRRHNDEINTMSRPAAAMSAIWSRRAADELEQLCDSFAPDVIHAHNTFPLISSSILWMANRRGIPIVQTLHNFRLLCPQATFLRAGKVCEDCLGKVPWRGVVRKCYRESTVQTAVAASMLTAHRMIGTYRDRVTTYVVLSQFCRDKFIEGGLPSSRIRVKPNFVVSSTAPELSERHGGLYVGRLSTEKGMEVLIDAARTLEQASLQVVGGGPLEAQIKAAFGSNYLGYKPREQVDALMRKARYLVAPSTCYETFGLALVEAFACGTPVIASRHGAFAEIVAEGITGLMFTPGDAGDLAKKIAWAEAHPEEMQRMGQAARMEYEQKYTPQRNYEMLVDIYEDAIRTVHAERKQHQAA
jgi:glycosyltransferase involved in cell wall biosynthesis